MPSAARQRIPAELWRSNNFRSPGSSPIPLLQSQDIQAYPGHCDMSVTDGMKMNGGKRNVSMKSAKRCSPGNRKNGHVFTRRGSSDTLHEICSDSETMSYEMSTSPSSDSGLDCKSKSVSQSFDADSFALDSAEAPSPNQLPFPPVEWLKPKAAAEMASTVDSFHSILSCFASAQRCV